MQIREKFSASMMDLLSAVSHLLLAPVVPEASDTVRAALREERARWRTQVDEATTYLTDHAIQLLIAYKGDRIPTMAVRYSGDMRGVWISDRSEERKLILLRDTTQHCHALFFDSPLYILRRVRAAQELERLLNELESPEGQ